MGMGGDLTVTSQVEPGSAVEAEVNYVRNPPGEGGEVLQFVTEVEERSTMQTRPGRSVRIASARRLTTELDREGFVLVRHPSVVADFDLIQEDPEVDQCYTDEMAALLAQVTGAATTFMLGGGKKRYGESATEKLALLLNAKPARYPHADNTDASAEGQLEMIAAFVEDLNPERSRAGPSTTCGGR